MIKVSARSQPQAVALRITELLRYQQNISIQVIGAEALNQATKALIIARGLLQQDGLDLTIQPEFLGVIDQKGDEKTAVRLVAYVYQRPK